MGCGALMGSYTKEDVDAELASLTPRLPMAELMQGGVIKLQGANGFFNPNSLLDPKWLQDKLSPEQYRDAINHINTYTAYTHIGLSKVYMVSERAYREQLRTQAGMAAVEELNKRYPSVRFTYQATAQNMVMNTSYSTDPAVQYANRYKAQPAYSQMTLLYINVS